MTNLEKIRKQIETDDGLVKLMADLIEQRLDPSGDWCIHYCEHRCEEDCGSACDGEPMEICVKNWLNAESIEKSA